MLSTYYWKAGSWFRQYVKPMEGGENGKMASPKDPKEFKRPGDIIPGEGTNLFADDLNYATDEEIERLENWLKANGYWIGQPKRFNRGE